MAQAVVSDEKAREVKGYYATRPAWMTTVLDVLRTYPYLIPVIVFFVGWQILPIYSAARISFTDLNFLGNVPEHWIGLQNYRQLMHDGLFWKGLYRAFIFTSIFLPGMLMIPMVLAVLVDRVTNNRVASTYRLILLIHR